MNSSGIPLDIRTIMARSPSRVLYLHDFIVGEERLSTFSRNSSRWREFRLRYSDAGFRGEQSLPTFVDMTSILIPSLNTELSSLLFPIQPLESLVILCHLFSPASSIY
jgi:hypothetical protein